MMFMWLVASNISTPDIWPFHCLFYSFPLSNCLYTTSMVSRRLSLSYCIATALSSFISNQIMQPFLVLHLSAIAAILNMEFWEICCINLKLEKMTSTLWKFIVRILDWILENCLNNRKIGVTFQRPFYKTTTIGELEWYITTLLCIYQ